MSFKILLFLFCALITIPLSSQSKYIILSRAHNLYSQERFNKAKKLYVKLSSDFPCANYMLAVLYFKGQGVQKDYAKAIQYLDRAIQNDYLEAFYLKALMLEHGYGCKQNYKKAFLLYKKAAKESTPIKSHINSLDGKTVLIQQKGIAQAQNNLAVMYLKGLGTPIDTAEALKYFKLAADKGMAESEVALGQMYYNGTGVQQNALKGVFFFKKAALKGNKLGQYNIGMMYFIGKGVKQNDVKAKYWLSLAANQNLPEAQNNLAWMFTKDDVLLDKALVLAQKAVASSHSNANYLDTLGCVLYKQKKYKQAVEILQKAEKLSPGNLEIKNHLHKALLKAESELKK